MSVFDWRGPSQSGLCDAPLLAEARPQNAYYWRKKAGLTGTRKNPVRGWRENSCFFTEQGDRDRKAIKG